jgi:hypothetical protein
MKKVAKNGRKALLLCPFFNNEKVAKNERKVKAISLFFCHFLPLFQK